MKVLERRLAMVRLVDAWKRRRLTIGFVPTMGALHAGHAALIARAARENDRVVVSVFVNPAQFGPNEDFSRYPRTFLADRRLCASRGADAVYHPSVEEVYPAGFKTTVSVGGLSQVLEGRVRPGHFDGVATVVLELLATCAPDRAYFGEKDFQQLVVVKTLARDLGLRTRIVGCPTIRESDGLALSSRNRYLNARERLAAPGIHKALLFGAALARQGKAPQAIEAAVRRQLSHIGKVDYVALVDSETLEPAARSRGRLLTAVRLGRTRLIDNIPVSC